MQEDPAAKESLREVDLSLGCAAGSRNRASKPGTMPRWLRRAQFGVRSSMFCILRLAALFLGFGFSAHSASASKAALASAQQTSEGFALSFSQMKYAFSRIRSGNIFSFTN
jgi:hypothetical protein